VIDPRTSGGSIAAPGAVPSPPAVTEGSTKDLPLGPRKNVGCTIAARETDGTTTCIGERAGRR
jgi:hypothetical protein